jgi:glycosyltransferase involved in cell wall biosynthesis
MILVSIVIPCYNHVLYIERTIKSVLCSNYDNIELLIIDDGSTDSSYEIASEILKSNDKLTYFCILKQKNHGIVKTLNKLISMAHGEYIALLASDDVLTPDSIKDRVSYLENNPGYDAVVGRALLIDENDNQISSDASKYLYRADNILLKSEYIMDELVLRWSIVGPCFFVRKALYAKIGLYNENYVVEDREFFLRILVNSKLAYIDNIVAAYRIHKKNISRHFQSSVTVKLECAKINVFYAKLLKKRILRLFLRSHFIDVFLLKHNTLVFYYSSLS